MTRCQTCGTQNIEGSQYCDECGSMLNQREENRQPRSETFQPHPPNAPVFQSTNATSIGIPATAFEPVLKERSFENGKKAGSGAHAVLIIERGERMGTEFALAADESYIGRWDADNGVFPDVDLDRCDPEAKISRRHARITRADGKYSIEDLGSTNGTFVNRGKRLLPGNKNILTDGDEIIIGKTFLRFNVND